VWRGSGRGVEHGRSKGLSKGHVDGEEEDQGDGEEGDGEVYGSWADGAASEGIGEGVIEIVGGAAGAGGEKRDGGDEALEAERAAVVSGAGKGPEQDDGKNDVEEGDEAEPERVLGVEHVISAAKQSAAEEDVAEHVQGPEKADEEDGEGRAGNEENVAEGEAKAAENERHIAKVEEVLGAPGAPVDGKPEEKEERGENARGEGQGTLMRSKREHGTRERAEILTEVGKDARGGLGGGGRGRMRRF